MTTSLRRTALDRVDRLSGAGLGLLGLHDQIVSDITYAGPRRGFGRYTTMLHYVAFDKTSHSQSSLTMCAVLSPCMLPDPSRSLGLPLGARSRRRS